MNYIKSLDGLRGIAVLLVVLRHWQMPLLNIELGWTGVNIFFVLSGFLISTIILDDKKKYQFTEFIKFFFLKRTLRIFPIYYIYLLLVSCCLILFSALTDSNFISNSYTHLKHNYILLYSYTYNFHHVIDLVFSYDVMGSKFFGHLWSLAVEEQFYLVFPFVAYFINKKSLRYLMVLIIVISPVIRYIVGEYLILNYDDIFKVSHILYKTTFFQLDSLATGIFLSTFNINDLRIKQKHILTALALIVSILLLNVFLLRENNIDISYGTLSFKFMSDQMFYNTGTLLDYMYPLSFTFINFLTITFIIACLKNFKIISILNKKILVFVGKISYGVYLYHYGIYYVFTTIIFQQFKYESFTSNTFYEIALFLFYIAIVMLISTVSYKYLETPFLKLKSKLKPKIQESDL